MTESKNKDIPLPPKEPTPPPTRFINESFGGKYAEETVTISKKAYDRLVKRDECLSELEVISLSNCNDYQL